tara:strand:+ start:224 stop:1132 length:909 start_codon:yes stop_codon:yes gene_type:complete
MTNTSTTIIKYGVSGIGKTTDDGYSFPNGIFLAAAGALRSIEELCGYQPKQITVRSLKDALEAVDNLINLQSKGWAGLDPTDIPDALIVDDFSLMVETFTLDLQERGIKGFDLWRIIRHNVLLFRDKIQSLHMHCIVNCWEQAPTNKDKKGLTFFLRGGPKLPSDLPELFPAGFHMALRCRFSHERPGWGAVYQTKGDKDWTCRDRHNACPDPAPMNLGELLRSANYKMSRLALIASWQEDKVEELSQNFLAYGSPKQFANENYTLLINEGHHHLHARWTIRDAWDRALIRKANSTRFQNFI